MRKIKVFICNYNILEEIIEKWQLENKIDIHHTSISINSIECVALITYYSTP